MAVDSGLIIVGLIPMVIPYFYICLHYSFSYNYHYPLYPQISLGTSRIFDMCIYFWFFIAHQNCFKSKQNIFARCTSYWCSHCSSMWNTSGVISSSRTTQWVQCTLLENQYFFIQKGNAFHNCQENPECRRHYSKDTFFVAGSQLLTFTFTSW